MPRPHACVIGDVSLIRALGRSGLPVVVVTSDPDAPATRSRFCRGVVRTPSWVDEPERAVEALIDWARTEREPPVVFYQGDHDLLAVSRHRERLREVARIVLPPPGLVEDLVDKLRFAVLAERTGLPVPATRVLRRATADGIDGWADFPCVLKPAMRSHWFGSALQTEAVGTNQKALRVETRAELEALAPLVASHETDFILQAAVEGGEERILSYHAYVRPGGEVVTEFTGRKVRTAPRLYGLSTYVEITDDPVVKRQGREVMDRIQFSGVLKIDFKQDARDGRLYLLEINPRFSLWHHASTVAGAPIPELVYRDCVRPGSARAPGPLRAGVRWLNTREDYRALPEYRAAREISTPRWILQVLTAHVNEDLGLTDPLPNALELLGVLKRKLGRLRRAPAAARAV
jgi:D-aspartate ligase